MNPQQVLTLGPWQNLYSLVSGIFIILDILLVVGIVLAWMKVQAFRPHYFKSTESGRPAIIIKREFYSTQWESITRKASFASPDSLRIAIIEADALIDRLLLQIGFKGTTVAEKLKQISPADLTSIERLWRAHKVRNHLVHSPGYKVSNEEAKLTLEDFESVFKELKIL